ncbi:MAG: lycopene cyclase domain-containing protein [Patescibacteria group bacterium]|nr:lycopene cyclase domain-containing protein [Patescibacteria group bacterium]
MYKYLLLNTVFILFAASKFAYRRPSVSRKYWLSLIGVLLMTAVFDSLIIAADIVRYNPGHILGITIGSAPIEDFAYVIAAFLLIPALWGNDRSQSFQAKPTGEHE